MECDELDDRGKEKTRQQMRAIPEILADAGFHVYRILERGSAEERQPAPLAAVTGPLPDTERVAATIHSRYLERALASGIAAGSAPALVAWDRLPEEYRDANLAQARDVLAKLSLIGVRAEPLDGSEEAPGFTFTASELDLLARREHQRWMDHKLSRGWTLGPRDDARRTHPCLVPHDELPEAQRQRDVDAVLEIPQLLQRSGYRLVRGRGGS